MDVNIGALRVNQSHSIVKQGQSESKLLCAVDSLYNGHHRNHELVSVIAGVICSNSYSSGLQLLPAITGCPH